MSNDYKVKALLCYAVFPVSSLIIYIAELHSSRELRFHAMQGLITGLALIVICAVVSGLLGWIWFIGGLIKAALGVAVAALWIMCMVRAYRGEMFKLPIVGDIAERIIK